MWGGLAGRLAENLHKADLRETISRIGDVVAPPLDDDEEYETDEEYEEYYVEEEVDEEEDVDESKPSLGTFLQQVLDEEEEVHHQLEEQQDEERHARPMIPDEEEDEVVMNNVTTRPTGEAVKKHTTAAKERETPPAVAVQPTASKAPSLVPPPAERKGNETSRPPPPPPPVESRHFPGSPVPHPHVESRVTKPDAISYQGMSAKEPLRVASEQAKPISKVSVKEKPTPPMNHLKPLKAEKESLTAATLKVSETKQAKEPSSKEPVSPPQQSTKAVTPLPPKELPTAETRPKQVIFNHDSIRSKPAPTRTHASAQHNNNKTATTTLSPPPLLNCNDVDLLEQRCRELEKQLQHAETHILELQSDAARRMDEEEEWRISHLRTFQEEQARMVAASTEAVENEHRREMAELRELLQHECLSLKRQLQEEQAASRQQSQEFARLLQEAEARTKAAEHEKHLALSKQESSTAQAKQRQERAVRMAEDKLAHTMAKLDEREAEVKKLKAAIQELKASTTEHREVAEEAEEEMDELHTENEMLRQSLMTMQAERDELQKQLTYLEAQKEKMGGLQMELKMLKEQRDRERAHRETAAVNAESSQAELEAERDAALSTARDLEQQLMATLADLDVARSDTERIMIGHANLQSALEAFQSEREAEMSLVEEQRMMAEEATAAAHAAAIEATHEANEARMRQVQMAADAAVKNVMAEVQALQAKLEESRKDNVNLRRSLDEAINRLQTSQEDVIDRVLMKNILLDWFSKNGKGKREVLAVMASLLHFTEEEREKIHLGDGGGTLGKVVGAVAAPFPPSAADIDHLEGDSVREKWVNFLLAEAGEDDDGKHDAGSVTTNGDTR